MWVRMLSAVCLGLGTMIEYQRIVKTLGEQLGNVRLTPAQGASTEIVSAILIGTAGFTGLPVSITHIVMSGIGGSRTSLRHDFARGHRMAGDHRHCGRTLLSPREPKSVAISPIAGWSFWGNL